MTTTTLTRSHVVSDLPAAPARTKTQELVVIKTDLVCTQPVSLPDLFVPGGTAWLIELVEREVELRSQHFDITTDAGRECIRRTAAEIKTFGNKLDKFGAEYKAGLMEMPKVIDAERRHAKERFEQLTGGVMADLLEYEAKEKARVDALTGRLSALTALTQSLSVLPASEIELRCEHAIELYQDHEWQEYTERAGQVFEEVMQQIDSAFRIAVEAEQRAIREAEEARIKAETERIAREAEIRRRTEEQAEARRVADLEAAEARRVAQAKRFEDERKWNIEGQIAKIKDLAVRLPATQTPAFFENRLSALDAISSDFEFMEYTDQANDEIENARKLLTAALQNARHLQQQREAQAAADLAQRQKQRVMEAAEAERKRIQDAAAAEAQRAAEAKANTENRKRINRDIRDGFMRFGLSEECARLAALALIEGKIDHVEVRYV